MSGALLEQWFVQHCLDTDSMKVIAQEGLNPEILPTEDVRGVYKYALDYYFDSGKTHAITVAALATFEVGKSRTYLDILNDLGIDPSDAPELTITDVLEKLKGQYILQQVQRFNQDFGILMADSSVTDRLAVASKAASGLTEMISKLTPRRNRQTAASGVSDALEMYEDRQNGVAIDGMAFGLDEVDNHIMRVRPGELAVFAASPKWGKSLFSVVVALAEWRRGRDIALFTLENSIEMTMDRIACSAVRVDSALWQRGMCEPSDVQRVMDFRDQLKAAPNHIHVLQPLPGQRNPEFIMRQAQVLDVDSVVIDQMSHLEHPTPRPGKPRHEVVRDIMQSLKLAASTAAVPLPVLLMSQISREGKKAADLRGRHSMEDIAESSEMEKTPDLVMTGYQSRDMWVANQAILQIVAARRVEYKMWSVLWYPSFGAMKVRGEI